MDTTQIESKLKDLEGLPSHVRSWKVEQGKDATSDPAIWVWAVLDRDETDPRRRAAIRKKVLETLRDKENSASLVYVRFRTKSEEEAAS
jgi:hypothetical protein